MKHALTLLTALLLAPLAALHPKDHIMSIRNTRTMMHLFLMLMAAGAFVNGTQVSAQSSQLIGPQTTLHYAAGANGTGTPLSLGFNLADVSSVSALNNLPAGVKGLVWLGLCHGADNTFIRKVQPFIGNAKLFGFYLMDEPDPTGKWGMVLFGCRP